MVKQNHKIKTIMKKKTIFIKIKYKYYMKLNNKQTVSHFRLLIYRYCFDNTRDITMALYIYIIKVLFFKHGLQSLRCSEYLELENYVLLLVTRFNIFEKYF